MIFAGGDPRGITRREAIAGGAVALGAGMLWGTSAFAAPVDEVSWRHTVTPATTNLLAVLGAFSKGPVNQAVLVTSWSDFESLFGGFSADSSLAVYAVWQFFLNGGIGAWIVRLDAPDSAVAQGTIGPLSLRASHEGVWADGLVVELRPSSGAQQLDLTVSSPATAGQAGSVIETLTGLTNDAADLAAAITNQSQYVSATAQGAGPVPPGTQALAGGADGTWSVDSFADAVLAQLGEPASSAAPGPALDQIAPQVFNLMCVPDLVFLATTAQGSAIAAAHRFCQTRKAFLIVDPPPPAAALANAWLPGAEATSIDAVGTPGGMASLNDWSGQVLSPEHDAAATYYPWLQIPDPFAPDTQRFVPPSGSVAGVYATTDTNRGVWKAPAGIAAAPNGVMGLADSTVDDTVNGILNSQGINCLRSFPGPGIVVWGARTLAGATLSDSPYKYVSVSRLSFYVQQTLQESLKWATFEPNGPTLWSWLSIEVTAFLSGLFSSGAFGAATAAQAFQVTCDATTTSAADIAAGVVNITVGFQPALPAEFIVLPITISASAPAA